MTWMANNIEGYEDIGAGALPDDHARNAMAIVSYFIKEYNTNIASIIHAFANTIPWALTANESAVGWEPEEPFEPLTALRLFLSFAQPTWWDGDAYGEGEHIPLHLLMTIDGPFAPNLLIWGFRWNEFTVVPVSKWQAKNLGALRKRLLAHLGHVWNAAETEWKDGKGADSWLLNNPFELTWEFELEQETSDEYDVYGPLPVALSVLDVNVEFPTADTAMSYVGLRPTAFDKPLHVMTSKGQAARAAREVLRHIVLHCATNLEQKAAEMEALDPLEILGNSESTPVFRSIAPDTYRIPYLQKIFPFDNMFPGMQNLFQVETCRGREAAYLCLQPLPDPEGYMTIPVIWPAGFDGHILNCNPEEVQPEILDDIVPNNDYEEERYVRFELMVDHSQKMDSAQPPGQFFPVLSGNFATSVDCVFVYRLITGRWLTWSSVELEDFKYYCATKGWKWLPDGGYPNTGLEKFWWHQWLQRFARASAWQWLWDDSLVEGWEQEMAEKLALDWNQEEKFQPFLPKNNALWSKLNDLPLWDGVYGDEFSVDTQGFGVRHQRVALRVEKTLSPGTVFACTGEAGVCFTFPLAADCPQGATPYVNSDDGGDPGEPAYWETDGQEMSRSPFAWPTSAQWGSFCGFLFHSPYWACAGDIPGVAPTYNCADIQENEYVGDGSFGAIGFGFLPHLLP